MKRVWVPAILVLWAFLALFPILTQPGAIPMPRVPQVTDFSVTHWPIARYVHDSIAQYGAVPLWNAMLMSGQPFAADPLAGYWYLPNWLTFWQPEPWMFALLFWLHLAWTGWGMLRLLRSDGMAEFPALLAALIWMATPRLIGYIGSGQVSIVFAISWTPWLLLAFRNAVRQPGLRQAAVAVLALAITFLADIRWGLMGGLFAAAYAGSQVDVRRVPWRRLLPLALLGSALFLLMTAGLTLPMTEFAGLSRRASMSITEMAGFSLTPEMLLGLLIPPYGMLYELVVYVGSLPLLLAVLAIPRRKFFWLLAALAAAVYALGANAFLFPALARLLPGFSWLRVPARAWFLAAFCLAVLAGWGVDGLKTALSNARVPRWGLALGMASLIVLTAANLQWYNASQLTAVSIDPSEVNRWLEAQPGIFRVYSPDGSLALPNRLQSANGVNPLHLASYAAYLEKASGIPAEGYSVSLPNVYVDASTSSEIVERAAKPDTAFLGKLNVKYLAAGFPLEGAALQLVKKIGQTMIYENLAFQPRARMEGAQVEIQHWSPDRIELAAEGAAGTLVLSEIAYPGWQVAVDGQPAKIQTIDGLFRGVNLEAGKHQVFFEFRPCRLYAGVGLAGVGWLACLVLIWRPFWPARNA